MASRVFHVGLLPSGRGVRTVRLHTRGLLEVTRSVAQQVGDLPDPGRARMLEFTQKEMVATCVRGVTRKPLQLVFREAPPAAPGATPPPKQVDLKATFDAVKGDEHWIDLTYQDLVADGEKNMLEIFSDPRDWQAVFAYCNSLGREGGLGAAPFVGPTLTIASE